MAELRLECLGAQTGVGVVGSEPGWAEPRSWQRGLGACGKLEEAPVGERVMHQRVEATNRDDNGGAGASEDARCQAGVPRGGPCRWETEAAWATWGACSDGGGARSGGSGGGPANSWSHQPL